MMAASGTRVDLDTLKELAYLLFSLAEKKASAEPAWVSRSRRDGPSPRVRARRPHGWRRRAAEKDVVDTIDDLDLAVRDVREEHDRLRRALDDLVRNGLDEVVAR